MRDLDDTLIFESYENDFVKVYHGGAKFHRVDARINKPKSGRFESGVGINTTTRYETARRYAAGNKVVNLFYLDKNLKLVEDIQVEPQLIFQFVRQYIGSGKRGKQLIEDVKNYLQRTGKTEYPLNFLINLGVNYQLGGKLGLYINDFVVEMGGDASLYHQSGEEDWLIIHNPKIIKKIIHTRPSDIGLDDRLLPRIREQLK
jgi:hypothetical protein